MWPAMLSVLPEDYGFELSATHMAGVLVMAKLGIFGSQLLFSWLLSEESRGKYFSYAFLALLLCTAALFAVTVNVTLPAKAKAMGWARRVKSQ